MQIFRSRSDDVAMVVAVAVLAKKPGHALGGLDRIGPLLGDLHRTRLWLNDATRVVLANGLGLLGVSAPERL